MPIGANDKPFIRILIIFCIAVIVFSLFLISCTVTHKNKSVHRETVDSSSVVKIDSTYKKSIDSSAIKKENTVTIKEKSDDYEKETVIEFTPTTDTSNIVRKTNPADYFPPIAKITIKEKGTKKEKEIKQETKSDSTHLVKEDSSKGAKNITTTVHKNESDRNVKKDSCNYWNLLWLLLLLIPAYICYRNWPKIKTFLKIA